MKFGPISWRLCVVHFVMCLCVVLFVMCLCVVLVVGRLCVVLFVWCLCVVLSLAVSPLARAKWTLESEETKSFKGETAKKR